MPFSLVLEKTSKTTTNSQENKPEDPQPNQPKFFLEAQMIKIKLCRRPSNLEKDLRLGRMEREEDGFSYNDDNNEFTVGRPKWPG